MVRKCIAEVEKRGIEEVGIYRVSGVASEIQALKEAFDTCKLCLLQNKVLNGLKRLPIIVKVLSNEEGL